MERSLLLEPSASLKGLKLIGWGAGQDFTTYFPRHEFNLAYTIDIYPENFGRRIHGVDVRGPEVLRGEDPEACLILVYSTAWFEVLRQIRALGPFRAVRAHGAPGMDTSVERAVELARRADGARGRSKASRAIVVQGPLHEKVTETVLRCYAVAHPNDALILSTWNGEDSEELHRLSPFADAILLNDSPAFAGDHSRNCQIRSTLAGLAEAKRLGIRRVVKTRTDSVLASPDALDRLDGALDQWPVEGRLRRFMRRRIAFLADASWRYVPYHFTDQVMYGETDDMLDYWSAEFQTEALTTLSGTDSVLDLSRSGAPPECYFAASYLRRNGVDPVSTIERGWEMLRDGFVAIDGHALDWFWWKVMALVEDAPDPDAKPPSELQQVHTHASWRELFGTEAWRDRARALDAAPPRLADFWRTGAKVATDPGTRP
jgi:hypothetical protein